MAQKRLRIVFGNEDIRQNSAGTATGGACINDCAALQITEPRLNLALRLKKPPRKQDWNGWPDVRRMSACGQVLPKGEALSLV